MSDTEATGVEGGTGDEPDDPYEGLQPGDTAGGLVLGELHADGAGEEADDRDDSHPLARAAREAQAREVQGSEAAEPQVAAKVDAQDAEAPGAEKPGAEPAVAPDAATTQPTDAANADTQVDPPLLGEKADEAFWQREEQKAVDAALEPLFGTYAQASDASDAAARSLAEFRDRFETTDPDTNEKISIPLTLGDIDNYNKLREAADRAKASFDGIKRQCTDARAKAVTGLFARAAVADHGPELKPHVAKIEALVARGIAPGKFTKQELLALVGATPSQAAGAETPSPTPTEGEKPRDAQGRYVSEADVDRAAAADVLAAKARAGVVVSTGTGARKPGAPAQPAASEQGQDIEARLERRRSQLTPDQQRIFDRMRGNE